MPFCCPGYIECAVVRFHIIIAYIIWNSNRVTSIDVVTGIMDKKTDEARVNIIFSTC